MRILRKKGNGQSRELVERSVRLELKIGRRASEPKSGLMLLGEQVANAASK